MRCTVHPRVCGERNRNARADTTAYGSSPRVRGTLIRGAVQVIDGRFIPACAGNATGEIVGTLNGSVHPRVCGERLKRSLCWHPRSGSSPRVRGTLINGMDHDTCARFIPACAGNAKVKQLRVAELSVHPRVCGEREIPPGMIWTQDGSSPRVRGTLEHRRRQ